MKKVLLGTLAVLTLAACSKDEVIQQNPNDEITFSVVTNKAVSRAADGYCNNAKPKDFQVWAEVGNKNYFAQERYVLSSGSTYTISGPVRYWPETDATKINFYAACNKGVKEILDEHGVGTGTFEEAESDVAINGWTSAEPTTPASKVIKDYIIENDVTKQKDLLYAVVKDAKRPAGTEGKITINFRHALSQIEFMAKNENPNIYVEISQVKVYQVNSKGDFIFPSTTDGNIDKHDFTGSYPAPAKVGTWANWSTLANYATTTFTAVPLSQKKVTAESPLTYGAAQADASGLTTKDDSGKEYSSNTMYLLPQKFQATDGADPKLTKVWSGSGKPTAGAHFLVKTKIWNVAAGDGKRTDDANNIVLWGDTNGKDIAVPIPADTNWEPGKRYVYTFVFTTIGNGGTDPEKGEPVLIPIKLDVTVDDFVDGFTGTEGDITMTK